MVDCLFCNIIGGSIPSYKVFENDLFLGFLDVYPKVKGHTLIIPKKHHRWVYDVPEFGEYWEAALLATKAIKRALKPEWVSYFTYGAVPHAHIHIMPRYEKMSADIPESAMLPHKTLQFTKEEFSKIAAKIISHY